MTQTSRFWNGTALGDALVEAPYDAPTEFAKVLMAISGADNDPNKGGVWYNDLSELAATNPATTTVRIASGRAQVWGTWFESDANVDETPAAPSGATRVDRYVLRKDWAAQTVRIFRIAGIEGGGAPSLVQSVGTTWDYPIVQASTTTGGVVTLTDQRTFLGGFVNPMTTLGDIIQALASGVPSRLGLGTSRQVPSVNSGATALEYVGGAGGVVTHQVAGDAGKKLQRGTVSITVGAVDQPIYAAETAVTFPLTFGTTPQVAPGGTTTAAAHAGGVRSITTTGCTLTYFSNSISAAFVNCGWIGLG